MHIGNVKNSKDFKTSKQKNYPKLKQLVKYKLKTPTTERNYQILCRARKSKGRYKHWFNVRSFNDEILHRSNWDEVENRKNNAMKIF